MAWRRLGLTRHRLVVAAGWGIAAYGTWLAYAWLAPGWWALPVLAGAHAIDGWRAQRRHGSPALSPGRPRHLGFRAAQVVGAAAVAALVGYRPDWLITGALAASAALRLGDESPGEHQANASPEG